MFTTKSIITTFQMWNKALLALILLLNFAACKQVDKKPYLLSHLENVRTFEQQDHNFCTSLNLNFAAEDDTKNELYWRCRLTLARYKIITDGYNPNRLRNNAEVSDLMSRISIKLSQIVEPNLIKENKKLDGMDHNRCLRLGFKVDTIDQADVDDYFSCRYKLIEERIITPPYGNEDYEDYPNSSYNLSFAIDRRMDEENKAHQKAKEEYPECLKFDIRSDEFKKCSAAANEARKCFSEIKNQKFRKEAEEKLSCQQQAYLRFPSSMLKEEDERKMEIERMKKNSDYYNGGNFAAIGIDLQLDALSKKNNKKKTKKEIMAAINSDQKFYSKYDLTQLRQSLIASCKKDADKIVAQYVKDLETSCQKIAETF